MPQELHPESRSPQDPLATGPYSGPGPGPGADDQHVPVAESIERYALGEELARGGMGVVVRATDTVLGRDVAVKLLRDRGGIGAAAVARFFAEGRITGRLQHPAIPPIHDLGTFADGRPFLAMKLIGGSTLESLLRGRQETAHERGRFVAVFEQVCQAVAYAHSQGVIHRDLKPANVMVGAFGEVQVMDWGLAKQYTGREQPGSVLSGEVRQPQESDPTATTDFTDGNQSTDRTRDGQTLGTPAYMPPEQACGEVQQIGPWSDVFALGGILCAILTGRPTYTGSSGSDVLRKASTADLADAFARLDACEADLELVALCKHCLSPAPAERAQHAGEVAIRIAEYRAGVEQRLRDAERERAAAEAQTAEQRKRRKVQLGLALAIGLLLLLGGVFAWYTDRQAERAARERTRLEGERLAQQAVFETERRIRGEQVQEQVSRLLGVATELRAQYRYAEAAVVLEQARRAATEAPTLLTTIGQAQANLELVRELDAVRLKRSTRRIDGAGGKSSLNELEAARDYRAVLARHRIDVLSDPERAGRRIAASAIKAEIVAALDDWAFRESDEAVRDRVLITVRIADPNPQLVPFRDPAVWNDPARVRQLAAAVDVTRITPAAVVTIADVILRYGRENPAPLVRKALLYHPREFLLAFDLGQFVSGKGEEEAAAYRAARALRPDSPVVLLNMGVAFDSAGKVDEAIAAFREAIQLDPNFPDAHYNLGNTLYRKGELEEAVTCLRAAIRLAPKFASAWNNLGIVLDDKGDHAAATAAYLEAVRADPKSASSYANLGNARHKSGDNPGAVEAFREAIRLDPNLASARSGLGNALLDRGELDAAVQALRELVRLDPEYPNAHYNFGVALTKTGKFAEAVAAFREAVHRNPKHSLAHYNLGTCLGRTGDSKEAVLVLREAARLDPTHVLTQINLGNALEDTGDFAEAATAFREAVRLAPKDTLARMNLARVLDRGGDRAGSIRALEELTKIDPKHVAAHVTLADFYLRRFRFNEAVAAARVAVEVEPGNARFHVLLAEALFRAGDTAGSRAAMMEAIRLDPRFESLLMKLPPVAVAPMPREVNR